MEAAHHAFEHISRHTFVNLFPKIDSWLGNCWANESAFFILMYVGKWPS